MIFSTIQQLNFKKWSQQKLRICFQSNKIYFCQIFTKTSLNQSKHWNVMQVVSLIFFFHKPVNVQKVQAKFFQFSFTCTLHKHWIKTKRNVKFLCHEVISQVLCWDNFLWWKEWQKTKSHLHFIVSKDFVVIPLKGCTFILISLINKFVLLTQQLQLVYS